MLVENAKMKGGRADARPMTDAEHADMVDRLRALNMPDVKV